MLFWIIKILCTTVGETISDLLNVDLGFGPERTGLVMAAFLVAALTIQFWYRKYEPWIYWLVVVLISVVGTIATDELHDVAGISLLTLTVVFTGVLLAVLVSWYVVEGTLSIRTIHSRRREGFYWATVMATFALGTAAGDWALEGSQEGLGSLRGGLLLSGGIFGAIILGVGLAHRYLKLDPIVSFWIAYVFTRPFGANLGDFLGGPNLVDEAGGPGVGGLGIGPEIVSSAFLAAILACVIYLTLTKKDRIAEPR